MSAAPPTGRKPEPIMLRADITPAEHRRIKKLAIDRGVRTPAVVADLLRKGLHNGR